MKATFEDRVALLSPERRRLLESIAARRASGGRPGRDDGAVLLRPGDEPTSVVLIHPSGGALFCYVPLIRALRAGPRVLGVTSHAEDRDAPVRERVAAVASRALAAVRAETPLERCVLVGWSYGGSVAFEVARQVAALGAAAPPVVVLDSPFLPEAEVEIPAEQELRRQFVYDMARLDGVAPERVAPLLAPIVGEVPPLPELLAAAGVRSGLTEAEVTDRYLTFVAAASALHCYRPAGSYPGPVRLVTAGPEPEIAAGWRGVSAGPFRHVAVPGDHYTLFDPANLPVVVRTIEGALAGLVAGR